MDSKVIIGAFVIAALAGGGGYYAGSKYGTGSARGGQFNRTGFQRQAGADGNSGVRFSGGGAAFGQIIAQDENSITVKLSGGPDAQTNGGTGSKIVLINSGTEVMKSVNGSMSDLSVGTNVMVNGTQNTDGSISARTVQIRPGGSLFPGGGQNQGAPRQQ